MKTTRKLRELLARKEPLVAAGGHDALSARMAAQAGFDAVYMTGAGVSASLLGQPDVGLATLTEMADQGRRMASAARGVPLLADADTGYGNAINAMRTVRDYERAGLAGLHIEDQVLPKKCGHFEGKELISVDEMVGKVRAALEAREDPDFLVIARTDARSVSGLAEAIARAQSYVAAGAEAIFLETPRSIEEYSEVARALPGVILVADVTEGGKSPSLTAQEYYRLGFQIVLFSGSASRAVMATLGDFYARLKAEGTTNEMTSEILPFAERNRILGLEDFYELERRFSARGHAAKGD